MDVPQNLKLIQKCGMKGTTEAMTFDCHWKNMEIWVERKHLVIYSGYNVTTVFSISTKEVFNITGCMALSKQDFGS